MYKELSIWVANLKQEKNKQKHKQYEDIIFKQANNDKVLDRDLIDNNLTPVTFNRTDTKLTLKWLADWQFRQQLILLKYL